MPAMVLNSFSSRLAKDVQERKNQEKAKEMTKRTPASPRNRM
jgi:hypothetical protein